MPDPAPWSGNCDVVTIWNGNGNGAPRNTRRVVPEVSSFSSNSLNPMDDISASNDNSISFAFNGNSPDLQTNISKGFDEIVNQEEPTITTSTNTSAESIGPSKPLIEITDSPVSNLAGATSNDISSLDTEEEPISRSSSSIPTLITSKEPDSRASSTFGVTSNGSPLVSITPDDMLE